MSSYLVPFLSWVVLCATYASPLFVQDRILTISFDLMDLQGNMHSLSQNDLGRVRAYVFLSTTCPIANSYTQELNRLAKSAPYNVQFFGIISEPSVKRADAVKHVTDYQFWNYNWQDEYYLEKPFELPAGTTLEVTATFDNSSDNPSNPSSPPKRVTWGEETTDEMLFCFLLLTAEKPEDLIHVIFDNLRHDTEQTRGVK